MTGASADLFEPPAVASDTSRLFFAILPDAAQQAAMVGVQRRLGLRDGPRPPHVLHLSLLRVRPEELAQAVAAAGRVTMTAFDVRFDRVMKFAGNAIVAGGGDDLEGVRMLRADIVGQTAGGARSAFDPHVTLAYSAQPFEERWIDPIAFRVREFVLVESLVGQTRHEVRGRWTLRERSATGSGDTRRVSPGGGYLYAGG